MGAPLIQWAPAGFWRRTAAALIDVVGGGLLLFFSAGMLASLARPAHQRPLSSSDLILASIVAAMLFLGPLAYALIYWRDSATLGMRALGLRLVDGCTGDLPSTEQVVLRMAGTFYCALPVGLGFLSVAVAADRRGWHDRLSGTTVVRARSLSHEWVWNGSEWVWMPAAVASTVPVPTWRRTPSAPPAPRSSWTWTDVLPLVVLFAPAALLSQLVVVVALHVVRIGHGHPAAISLLFDAAAYAANLSLVWLFVGVRRHARLRDLGLRLPHWPWLLAVLPALFAAWTVEGVLGKLGSAFLPTSPHNQCHAIQSDYGSALALGLLGVAVMAPVVEEILFRGVLFGWLRGRIPVPAAIVLSAAIFSLAHLGWMEWSLLLPIFGIGCLLAGLYHYSRSLWPGILVHASINAVATLVVVLGGTHC
jgi:membrane protease YdiL (CAAX protease family)